MCLNALGTLPVVYLLNSFPTLHYEFDKNYMINNLKRAIVEDKITMMTMTKKLLMYPLYKSMMALSNLGRGRGSVGAIKQQG